MLIGTDSQIVANAINGDQLDLSCFGLIIANCKPIIHDINQSRVDFVHKSANSAAHCIARAAFSLSGHEV